jgi:Tfp pilus assembly protein PilX
MKTWPLKKLSAASRSGSVLVGAMLFAVVIATCLVSYLLLVQNSDRIVARAQHWHSALAIAESGVEEGMCQLNSSGSAAANGWSQSGNTYTLSSRPFGEGTYSVSLQMASSGTQATIYSTGTVTAPITGAVIKRAVKVLAGNQGYFNVGMGALSGITGKGNAGIMVDSWNSHDTNNIQDSNGQYNQYHGTNGNIALVSGQAALQNQNINGALYLGPQATTSGSTPPTGGVYNDWNGNFPDVVYPTVDTNGNAIYQQPMPTPITIGSGKNAITAIDLTSSGYYIVLDNSSIVVEPGVTATLLIHTTSWTPSNVIINGGTTNSGTIIAYQEQGVADLSSFQGAINGRPENFIYYGLTTQSTGITFGGNGTFVGVIYAPEADITLKGGGNGNNIVGAVIGKTITVNGHYDIHYDESLARLFSSVFVVTSWEEL